MPPVATSTPGLAVVSFESVQPARANAIASEPVKARGPRDFVGTVTLRDTRTGAELACRKLGEPAASTVSLDEAEHIFKDKADRLIVGAGQDGMVKLSDEATAFFKQHHCKVTLLPTPEAVEFWNREKGEAIGLFHVTC